MGWLVIEAFRETATCNNLHRGSLWERMMSLVRSRVSFLAHTRIKVGRTSYIAPQRSDHGAPVRRARLGHSRRHLDGHPKCRNVRRCQRPHGPKHQYRREKVRAKGKENGAVRLSFFRHFARKRSVGRTRVSAFLFGRSFHTNVQCDEEFGIFTTHDLFAFSISNS
jgi:hypothetical protein